jgi:cobalt-zinc-cadmium efflux system membrane fusion protein
MFLIAFLALLGVQCNRGEAPIFDPREHDPPEFSSEGDMVRLPESVQEAVGIEVEQVDYRQCRSLLQAMGKILAPQQQTAIVSHPFPSRVAEIHVGIGEWVEKGQALITLESQEVGAAKSEFYKARADLELAQLNLAREKRLSETGIGIKKNLLAAEAEQKIAQSNEEAAEKTLHVLGFTEAQVQEIAETHQISPAITLYAPIEGKVVSNEAVLGMLVDQSTEIMKIIDPTVLWIDAQIYEKDLAKVKIGQRVEITVPAYPEIVFQGRLSYIGDVVDDQTRTITLRAEVRNRMAEEAVEQAAFEDPQAEVDDHHFLLKPGMFADVDVRLNGDEPVLAVPASAVLEEGDQKIVFVCHDGAFVRREVETGVVDGQYRQIIRGLEADEQVVTEGNYQLKSQLHGEALHAAHTH